MFSFKLRSVGCNICATSARSYVLPALIIWLQQMLQDSYARTFSRSEFSFKFWFIWYTTCPIWVTSNFSSLMFRKYFAFYDPVRKYTYVRFVDLESIQWGVFCDTYIIYFSNTPKIHYNIRKDNKIHYITIKDK
jgi:hypothetical protein